LQTVRDRTAHFASNRKGRANVRGGASACGDARKTDKKTINITSCAHVGASPNTRGAENNKSKKSIYISALRRQSLTNIRGV